MADDINATSTHPRKHVFSRVLDTWQRPYQTSRSVLEVTAMSKQNRYQLQQTAHVPYGNLSCREACLSDYGFLEGAPAGFAAFRAASREISWPAVSTQ